MDILYFVPLSYILGTITAYTNWNPLEYREELRKIQSDNKSCAAFDSALYFGKKTAGMSTKINVSTLKYEIIGTPAKETDPLLEWQEYLNKFLFGDKTTDEDDEADVSTGSQLSDSQSEQETQDFNETGGYDLDPDLTDKNDYLEHNPSGKLHRAELFNNYSGVHLPFKEYMFKGHLRLKLTSDLMQTAVNAFAILSVGSMDDLLALPSEYVLLSSRTIAMMKLREEQFAAMWTVVKANRSTSEIQIDTLEFFRPLFKYVPAKEIAKLDLLDPRILSYIGTHPDLDRLQVGVVASKYMKLNPNWMEPMYLNTMNNLLCGIPMSRMRRIPEKTYLQLSQQIFYHIRACDPLQRRFYLFMMTNSQAVGRSYSWGAPDVAKLGFLLTEVDNTDLSEINPEAMVGISSRVIHAMSQESLSYFTDQQVQYLSDLSYNIYATKMKMYKQYQRQFNGVFNLRRPTITFLLLIFGVSNYCSKQNV